MATGSQVHCCSFLQYNPEMHRLFGLKFPYFDILTRTCPRDRLVRGSGVCVNCLCDPFIGLDLCLLLTYRNIRLQPSYWR